MSQQRAYTSALYSLDTPRAEFQIVATSDHVVIDIQARNFAVDGRRHTEYALAHLSKKDALRLLRLLNEAISATDRVEDPRQTSLWSNASTAAVADELRRGQLS